VRNLLIGLVIVILTGLGVWYFLGRTAKHPTMPSMQHEGIMSTQEGSSLEMVECPVTGEKIHKGMAAGKTVYKGKTYYFCCAGCPEKFKNNPEKYLKSKPLDKKH